MQDKLTELAALDAKATPGPWSDESHECLNIRAPQGHAICRICWLTDKGRIDNEEGHANAALIVAMRNALPELLRDEQIYYDLMRERDAALARAEKAEAWIKAVQAQVAVLCPEITTVFDNHATDICQALRNLKVRWRKRAEKSEAERDWLIRELSPDEGPCERLGIDLPEWCTLVDECGSWGCSTEHLACWLKYAAQEAAKREGSGE